jgi:hypothetical protein
MSVLLPDTTVCVYEPHIPEKIIVHPSLEENIYCGVDEDVKYSIG